MPDERMPDDPRPGGRQDPGADYRIEKYTPRYRQQVARLQRHLWSDDVELNLRYFAWKHEQNPYLPEPLVYLALHGDELVGMRAMFGARWEVDGREYLVPCAGDLVIAPEHRNKGLFTRIMAAALEDLDGLGIPYVFNLSAGPTTLLGSLAMGWRSTGSVRPVVRTAPQRRRGRAVTAMRRYLRALVSPFAMLDLRSRVRIGAPVTVTGRPRADAMAKLVARLGADGRIRHVRDAAYLAWRYRNPRCRYRFLYCDGSDLTGYLVLGWKLGRGGVDVVDWEFEDSAAGSALLDAAVTWGRFPTLTAWAASLPDASRALLEHHGFVESSPSGGLAGSNRKTVLIRPVGQRSSDAWSMGERNLLDLANWDLRQIYSDGA